MREKELFCEECGNKIPEDAKFCPKCGTPCPQDDDSIETQNGGTEEHVENVGEPIVENERSSDIKIDNFDNSEVPKESKNHISLTKKAKMIISILEMDLLYSTKALTKKAKMIISAVIAVIIIGAVGITAGIATKENSQTEKKVAKKEKAVKEDKKAETKKAITAKEEQKKVELERVEAIELSRLLTDPCIILGRECKVWEDSTITPSMIQGKAESDEEVNFTSSFTGEWNFEEIAEDMRSLLQQASYANSFNVSVSSIASNFNTPYRYEKGQTEDLRMINKIEFSAIDEEWGSRKAVNIYVDTKYEFTGAEWCISDIIYLGKNGIESQIQENNQNYYFREGENIVCDTNIRNLVDALNENDIETYYKLYKQISENEAENLVDIPSLKLKYSLGYLNEDNIPELVIWLFQEHNGESYGMHPIIYYVGEGGLYKKILHPVNGLPENLTYIPKGKKLLCKTSDSDFDTTWKEYDIYQSYMQVLEDTVIDRQESGNGHNQFPRIKGQRASEEEILNYIANTGISTTFDIYDSLEDAISNL